MDKQAIIDHLNEILKHEWTGVAQYAQAGFIVEGVWREVFAKAFLDNAEESFGHAKQVGDKIVALGGVPVATRNEIKQSRDLREVLEFSLAFEAKAVEMYDRAIDMAEGDKAARRVSRRYPQRRAGRGRRVHEAASRHRQCRRSDRIGLALSLTGGTGTWGRDR